MSITRRTRSLARTGVKVQRRIAVAQLLFWPTVLGGGLLIGGALAVAVRRSRTRPQPPREQSAAGQYQPSSL